MIIGGNFLRVSDFQKILFHDEPVHTDARAREEVQRNFDFLKSYAGSKVIYGINTGLGPMAQYRIKDSDQRQLQYNLIRSHSAGAGNLFTTELARATMLARLNSLMQARSGVHPSLVDLIATLLNEKVTVCIYERGGVGASGDLVQLAHLALNLLGEGEVLVDGKTEPAAAVFSRRNIRPLQIHIREGLALMNGTSAMTGVGMVNIIHARRLLNCAVVMSSMINELMESFDDHYAEELNEVKLHPGQSVVAAGMRALLSDSKRIRKRPDYLYRKEVSDDFFVDKVQEYYSLRCVPQVLGPVYDTLANVQTVLENEVNSANDNPVIDHVRKNVYHGGNFHGDYVSLAMDKLRIAITKLSMLSERQLNYILNDKLNGKLPPFINTGMLGLNFGLQGMQFMATSTVAENQTLSNSMYVHSIPANNDNQDIVSMGCNAALLTRRVIENTFDVLAVELLALAQAVDYLQCQSEMSPHTRKVYEEVRAIAPALATDEPQHERIRDISLYLARLGDDAEKWIPVSNRN